MSPSRNLGGVTRYRRFESGFLQQRVGHETSRAKSNPLSPGTEGSNPALSSGESANHRFLIGGVKSADNVGAFRSRTSRR
jgi:hypothetical protein